MSKFVNEWGTFTMVPNIFIERWRNLSDHARLLFVVLMFHTNQKDECAWPSYDQLQELTDWSRPTVSKAIKELEQYGWLERRKRFGKSAIYVLKRPNSSQNELLDTEGLTDSSSDSPVVNRMNYSSSQNELQKFKPLTTASYYEQDELTRRKEQDESMSNLRSTAGGSFSSPAEEVFQHWKTTLNHLKAKFDSKRKKLIEARLKDFSVDDLKAAIDGCRLSSFHQGDNDRFRKYDGIKVIFRDAEQIEHFMELANGIPDRNVAAPKKEYCGKCYEGWLPSDPAKGETCAKRCSCVEADRGGAPPVVTAGPVWNSLQGRFVTPAKPVADFGIRPCPEIGVTYCGQCHNGWLMPDSSKGEERARLCGCEQARRTGKENHTHYDDGRAKPAHMIGFVA